MLDDLEPKRPPMARTDHTIETRPDGRPPQRRGGLEPIADVMGRVLARARIDPAALNETTDA